MELNITVKFERPLGSSAIETLLKFLHDCEALILYPVARDCPFTRFGGKTLIPFLNTGLWFSISSGRQLGQQLLGSCHDARRGLGSCCPGLCHLHIQRHRTRQTVTQHDEGNILSSIRQNTWLNQNEGCWRMHPRLWFINFHSWTLVYFITTWCKDMVLPAADNSHWYFP